MVYVPDRDDDAVVGAVHGNVVAGPHDAVAPLAHAQVGQRDAGERGDCLVVGRTRSAASRVKAELVHLRQYSMGYALQSHYAPSQRVHLPIHHRHLLSGQPQTLLSDLPL